MNNNLNDKKISAIILAYEPDDIFVDEINLLKNQTYQLDKVLIVNTDKSKLYKKLSKEYRDKLDSLLNDDDIILKNIEKKDFDHGKTRNYATSLIDCDYLLFMTDDALPYDENLVYNLLIGFYDENVAISTARQVPKKNAKFTEKLVREYNYPDKTYIRDKSTITKYGIKNYFVSNVCSMYDKKIFEALFKFNENIPLNEDMLYAYKVVNNDFRIYYNKDAKVIHSHNFTYREQFFRNYDIAKSQRLNKEIFKNINSESEGKKLVQFVIKKCLEQKKLFCAIDFIVECFFRYMGFLFGKYF